MVTFFKGKAPLSQVPDNPHCLQGEIKVISTDAGNQGIVSSLLYPPSKKKLDILALTFRQTSGVSTQFYVYTVPLRSLDEVYALLGSQNPSPGGAYYTEYYPKGVRIMWGGQAAEAVNVPYTFGPGTLRFENSALLVFADTYFGANEYTHTWLLVGKVEEKESLFFK